jgi:hypothetical protein
MVTATKIRPFEVTMTATPEQKLQNQIDNIWADHEARQRAIVTGTYVPHVCDPLPAPSCPFPSLFDDEDEDDAPTEDFFECWPMQPAEI